MTFFFLTHPYCDLRMQRIVITTIMVLSGFHPALAQDIRGSWQNGTDMMHGAESSYEFHDGGTFTYYPPTYNELCIPVWIEGHYSIEGDSIYFIVNKIYTGAMKRLIRRDPRDSSFNNTEIFWETSTSHRIKPSRSNYWKVETGKPHVSDVDNPGRWVASFAYKQDENNRAFIIIDGDVFYYITPQE